MKSVYVPAAATVTSGKTTCASGAPPMLRTFCPPEQGRAVGDAGAADRVPGVLGLAHEHPVGGPEPYQTRLSAFGIR